MISFMNGMNDDRWVNGEDLKFEYAYFTKEKILGKSLLSVCFFNFPHLVVFQAQGRDQCDT